MFDFPFLIWRDEWLILPVVRTAVGRLAKACTWFCVAMAAAAVFELCLLYAGVPFGVLFGWFSYAGGVLLMMGAMLLLPWCLIVLAARRGVPATRPIAVLGALFGVIYGVSSLFTLLTGVVLLPQQGVLGLLLVVFSVLIICINWGYAEAAGTFARVRLIAAFVFYLLAILGDSPATYEAGVIFKLACCWAAYNPLSYLSAMAPRVVALPPVAKVEP